MSLHTPALGTSPIAFPSTHAGKRGPFSRSTRHPVRAEKLLFFVALALNAVFGMPEEGRAQDFVRNSVYVEGSRSGRLYSINYERRLTTHAVARTGVMMRDGGKNQIEFSTIPVMIGFLDGFHRFGGHRLELAAGPLLGVLRRGQEEEDVSNVVRAGFIIVVGYRYHPLTEGVLFRIGLTGRNSGGFMDQAFHVSLGYAF